MGFEKDEIAKQLAELGLVAIDRDVAKSIVDVAALMRELYAQEDRSDWFDVDDMAIKACYEVAAECAMRLEKQGGRAALQDPEASIGGFSLADAKKAQGKRQKVDSDVSGIKR